MTVADALVSGGAASGGTAPKSAAEEHPFPAAVSAGLAPTTVPLAPAGQAHTQVSAALSSGGDADSTAEPPATAKSADTAQATPAPAAPKQSKDLVHVVGRFFKRLFGGG